MKYLSIIIFLLATFKLSAQEVRVSSGKYADYYHIQYDLIPNQYSLNTEYSFNEGGQFEVFVPKTYFPIDAPNCRENIIIRMPYSDNEKRKRVLYDELLLSKAVTVTLELNPYIKILRKEPLQIELENCNVFFRHRAGDYYGKI